MVRCWHFCWWGSSWPCSFYQRRRQSRKGTNKAQRSNRTGSTSVPARNRIYNENHRRNCTTTSGQSPSVIKLWMSMAPIGPEHEALQRGAELKGYAAESNSRDGSTSPKSLQARITDIGFV
jgi:hypothetical protein